MSPYYDEVAKMIRKNIEVNHFLGQLVVNPKVVNQLEEYFRRKFNEEQKAQTKDA